MSLTSAKIIAQLPRLTKNYISKISSRVKACQNRPDEEVGSNSLILWQFLKHVGSKFIKYMCNLTALEFGKIRMILTDHVSVTWNFSPY